MPTFTRNNHSNHLMEKTLEKTSKHWPKVALIYDFDGTLSPQNMQEYDFLKAIGIKDKKEFWQESAAMRKEHHASDILCYMKLMLDKARAAKVSVRREQFVNFGKSIKFYPGVMEWFQLINRLGEENQVQIEHYINSSGLREMIEGTAIAHYFKEIYACSFMYEDGVATWPAVAVDFTTKTQFLYMINKGIRSVLDNHQVNDYIPENERPVPFSQMIYFGDGLTDIPCMRLIKNQGGNAIAIYRRRNPEQKRCAQQLVADERVNFACEANYREGGEIHQIVGSIIRQIKSKHDFDALQRRNRAKLS